MSIRLISDPERSLFFTSFTHEYKFLTFGIGFAKWKTHKADKTFLALGKCRNRQYGDHVNIFTAETSKSEIDGEIKVKHELKPLKDRIQIEELHKEYVKKFNNFAYQNYEIHDSSFYCLSKQKRKQLLDESKNGVLERKYYKIIKSPFEINKNVTDFF